MSRVSVGLDRQTVANALAKYGVPPAYVQELTEALGLPKPFGKQTMIITLEIPVEGMDPMGDTYKMGVEKLTELLRLYKMIPQPQVEEGLIATIETVEIVPRKEHR